MASGGNLQTLENELKDCLAKQLYSEALNIYEEIEGAGQMMTGHWIGKGDCMLRLRRKQDAKAAWLRAFELDPANAVLHDLLDQNFPGWTPPAPKLAPKPAEPPPAPVRPPEPPPSPRISAASTSSPGIPRAAALAAASRAGATAQPPTSAPATMGRINWNYVLEDYNDAMRGNPALKPPPIASPAGV